MTLIERLAASGPVLTDGAWGSLLQGRGLGAEECPDAWNLSHPEKVEEVARAYVEAGSQVILTNTFRANRLALVRYGLADRTAEVNRAGVAISLAAARGRAHVIASMGPSGKLLVTGETTEEELHAVFLEQAKLLAEAGAEAIVFETMADLAEAKVGLSAARQTGLPVVVSMVFGSGRNKDRTMMGVTPEQAAQELTGAGADAVGANCGVGIEDYLPICRRLRAATHLPVWMKPNAGQPALVEGRTVWRTTPEEFARQVPALLEAGAAFVGGCCGTTPEYIRSVAAALTATA